MPNSDDRLQADGATTVLLHRSTESLIEVAMGDVDRHQVHFLTPFRYVDAIESRFFRELGLATSLILDHGYGLPVVSAACTYAHPFGLDDVVRVRSEITAVGTTSLMMRHNFTAKDSTPALAVVTVVHVCVNRGTRQKAHLSALLCAVGLLDMEGRMPSPTNANRPSVDFTGDSPLPPTQHIERS